MIGRRLADAIADGKAVQDADQLGSRPDIELFQDAFDLGADRFPQTPLLSQFFLENVAGRPVQVANRGLDIRKVEIRSVVAVEDALVEVIDIGEPVGAGIKDAKFPSQPLPSQKVHDGRVARNSSRIGSIGAKPDASEGLMNVVELLRIDSREDDLEVAGVAGGPFQMAVGPDLGLGPDELESEDPPAVADRSAGQDLGGVDNVDAQRVAAEYEMSVVGRAVADINSPAIGLSSGPAVVKPFVGILDPAVVLDAELVDLGGRIGIANLPKPFDEVLALRGAAQRQEILLLLGGDDVAHFLVEPAAVGF